MALSTTSDIIEAFELYFGDETSLSSAEELNLVQKKYDDILASEEWEFLKKVATGTLNGTDITQPTDFDRMTSDLTIYMGTGENQFRVVPFTQRRQYKNQNNIFYYDAKNGKFVAPISQNDNYSFDYIYIPPALDTTNSNPIFPTRFYDMIYSAMLIDADIINLSDKARSYAAVNQKQYQDGLNDMKTWNKRNTSMNTYGL